MGVVWKALGRHVTLPPEDRHLFVWEGRRTGHLCWRGWWEGVEWQRQRPGAWSWEGPVWVCRVQSSIIYFLEGQNTIGNTNDFCECLSYSK